MANLPTLGPRGEGWVAIQAALFVVVGLAGLAATSALHGAMAGLAFGAGLALIAGGAALVAAGIGELRRGEAFTALPRPREAATLRESGPYRLVRHPVYGGLVLVALGWALARGSVPALVATAALLVFFDLKRRREEAWLLMKFPTYAAYRARTRRLIPWLY